MSVQERRMDEEKKTLDMERDLKVPEMTGAWPATI